MQDGHPIKRKERLYPTPAELLVLKATRILAQEAAGQISLETCCRQLDRLFKSPEARGIVAQFSGHELTPPTADDTARKLAELLRPRGSGSASDQPEDKAT